MKKLFIFLAIVCWTTDLMAQKQMGKLSIKPMAGVNLSSFSDAMIDMYRMKVGFTVGTELEYSLNPHVGLSLGLIYSQQGAKIDGTIDGMLKDENNEKWYTSTKMKGKLNCNYLNLPLFANIYIPAIKGLAIKTGFQVGILANDKMTSEGMIAMVNLDPIYNSFYRTADGRVPNQVMGYNVNMSDVCHSIDFGIPVGLSYEYNNIVLDARYYFGLTKIDKTDDPDTARNQYVSITLGYKFHF